MIIKAISRSSGSQLTAYLMQEHKADRDQAELLELRGFATPDLKAALCSVELEAEKTRCKNPLYHVSFRPDHGEHLTPEQWQASIDKLEHRLGLDGQARAVVLHEHEGEQHIHVVWSRIDRENNRALDLSFDAEKRVEIARQIEREYGLRELAPAHERTQESLSRADCEQAKRQGRDLADIRDTKEIIRDCWARSDNGESFETALDQANLVLARGDTPRAPLVIVDEYGKVHGVARTLGEKKHTVENRLADLDQTTLPSVAQAKEYQAEQQRRHEQARADRAREEAAKAEREAAKKEAQPAQDKTAVRAEQQRQPVAPLDKTTDFFKNLSEKVTRHTTEERTPPKQERQQEAARRQAAEHKARNAQEPPEGRTNPEAKTQAPEPEKIAIRAGKALAGGSLELLGGLGEKIIGPVTYEGIKQVAAQDQKHAYKGLDAAAQDYSRALTPEQKEQKAQELDRAAAQARKASDSYREAARKAKPGAESRAALRAGYRANFEAKKAEQEAARLRETEQQRQEREEREREEERRRRKQRERER